MIVDPTIRRATASDDFEVGRLVYGDPSPETVGITGDLRRAKELPLQLFHLGLGRAPADEVYLAVSGERALGALIARGAGVNYPVPLAKIPAVLGIAFRLYSIWELPGLIRRVRLRTQLDFPIPEGSLHVVEVHVDPEHRGCGIGTRLLRHAEQRAVELGCTRLNLTTALANRARLLYEKEGFRRVSVKTVAGYEAVTGTPGRAFYEKRL